NFLAAAARLTASHPDVLFAMAGSGTDPSNRELAAAVAAHGLGKRALLLGDRPDIESLYPAFDIVTLSSAFGEALPMVLGEAMASGVPCVATDSGDAGLVVGDTGIIVPPRDPAALAAGWRELVALGAEGRRALGVRARAHIVANYSLERIVAQYEALYRG